MYEDSSPVIKRLRALCRAFPQVFEKEAWGECTFRVTGGSMFAMTDNDHHHSGHIAVWVKAPPMVQEILTGSAPQRFFKPPYMGAKGWVGVRLDAGTDWEELAAILNDAYLMSAPKKLRGTLAVPAATGADGKRKRSAKPSPGKLPAAIRGKTR
jgi:hypothetical protein